MTLGRRKIHWLAGLIAGGVMLTLSGCSLTKVDKSFPLYDSASTGATVYWLRPETERTMGIADNAVTVELNGERLMRLGKGEYTKVNIVARDYTVTLKNKTETGPHWHVVDVKKRARWVFEPGETYYLAVQAVDGEFRGVKFQVEQLRDYDAQNMMAKLRKR